MLSMNSRICRVAFGAFLLVMSLTLDKKSIGYSSLFLFFHREIVDGKKILDAHAINDLMVKN